MRNIISIDPGTQKCGLLLADLDELSVISGKIVKRSHVIKFINNWYNSYKIDLVILGNGTTSKYWEAKLSPLARINLINEIILFYLAVC